MLDWAHLLDRFETHQDGTVTLHHVYEVWPVLSDPTKPFAMDTKLLMALSAPSRFAGGHRLIVRARGASGEVNGETAGEVTLTKGGLPGRVAACPWADLKTLGFPRAGDYFLEVLVDDIPVGLVTVFARQAQLAPRKQP